MTAEDTDNRPRKVIYCLLKEGHLVSQAKLILTVIEQKTQYNVEFGIREERTSKQSIRKCMEITQATLSLRRKKFPSSISNASWQRAEDARDRGKPSGTPCTARAGLFPVTCYSVWHWKRECNTREKGRH